MGSFSFIRSETTTKRSNISENDKYKVLVPKEFGGGYIRDIYEDYGKVFWHPTGYSYYVDADGNRYSGKALGMCDLYGILAYWNGYNKMIFNGDHRPYTMIDILRNGRTADQDNRWAGLKIGCYDDDVQKLKYPLKLVSASYNKTYEECPGISYSDPNQGFFKAYWNKEYVDYFEEIRGRERQMQQTIRHSENNMKIPTEKFRREVESILRQSISSDYVYTILESDAGTGDTLFDIIKEDVETSSAWQDEQWYNGDDIKFAIGRVLAVVCEKASDRL